jgi:hypothetical protein
VPIERTLQYSTRPRARPVAYARHPTRQSHAAYASGRRAWLAGSIGGVERRAVGREPGAHARVLVTHRDEPRAEVLVDHQPSRSM